MLLQDGIFLAALLIFSPTTKLYFDMQVLHSIVVRKSASLSPRCNSLTACIIHVWVWGRETGDAAAENHNSGDATNITWNKLWLQLHSSKNTFKHQWKHFKPRWELKLTSNLSGVIESICLYRAQLVQSETTHYTANALWKNKPRQKLLLKDGTFCQTKTMIACNHGSVLRLLERLHYQFVGDVVWRNQNNDSSSSHLSLDQNSELLTMTSNVHPSGRTLRPW